MSQKVWAPAVYDAVLHEVQQVIGEVAGVTPDEADPDMNLRDGLGLGMDEIVMVLLSCGDRLNTGFPREYVVSLHTVDDIVQCMLDLQVEAA